MHGAQRYEDRLSNYSPEQLEQFLLATESAPWEIEDGASGLFWHSNTFVFWVNEFVMLPKEFKIHQASWT